MALMDTNSRVRLLHAADRRISRGDRAESEFAAKPWPNLTITPGLKYNYVLRGLDAAVVGSAPSTAPSSQDFDELQPAIEVNYQIAKGWLGYA